MKTYKLGNLGDRVLTVKNRNGQHVATLRVKDVDMKYVELKWAEFRQVVSKVNGAATSVSNRAEGIKLQLHIGVTSGIRCVDFRKFYKHFGSEDSEIKPTRHGVALRLEECASLYTLIADINSAYPTIGSAQPCYYDDDHLNQMGWLNCLECHPFHVKLSQSTTP